jgi:hypothetical protein
MLTIRSFVLLVVASLAACLAFTDKAVAQKKWSPCKPVESATFAERIHVRCESAVDGKFSFFAASTNDSKFAARALSVIEAGQLAGKYISVLFDPSDLSGQAFGCLTKDCRTMSAVVLVDNLPDKCEIDNTQKGCPGYCTVSGTTDRSCPQFCTANPDVKGCPGYCQNHDDISCPGFCRRHTDNKACQRNSDECLNQHLAGCNENPR